MGCIVSSHDVMGSTDDSFRSEEAEAWFSERTSAKPLQGKWRRMREMLLHSTDISQFQHVRSRIASGHARAPRPCGAPRSGPRPALNSTSARAPTQVLKLSHDQVVNALTAFRAMDRTGDGSIDCDEFAQARPAPLLPGNRP